MNTYKPKGITFFDAKSKRNMILVEEGPYKGWVCYQVPSGSWVTLREATEEDKKMLTAALGKTKNTDEILDVGETC